MVLTSELFQAYINTAYRVYDGNSVETLQIGEASDFMVERMQSLGVTAACLITACNPFSEPLGRTENTARNAALAAEIRKAGLALIPGRGESLQDGWPGEESFLVFGLTKDLAVTWCRRYRQNAVVWIGSDGVPLLLLRDGSILGVGE